MNEQEIYERVTSAEQSVKSAHHRIDELADSNKKIAELLVELKYMRRDLNELMERVCAVEAKPVRRYDLIVTTVITTVVAFVVSLLVK